MRWKQQDANELGDQEWVPTGPNPFGVTIFYDDQEQEFVVVTEDGDHLGSAKTMAEAKEIGENLGYAPHKSLKVPTHRKIKSRPGGSQKQGYVT
jgi:hypothetical protein